MARHFARLKLALLGSSFRRGWRYAFSLILCVVYTVPLAAGAAYGLAWLGRSPQLGGVAGSMLTLGFVLLAVGWVVVPLLAFGLDETFDPARLQLLPLTRRQLVVGLAAASAVGIAPVATFIALLGAVIGFAPPGPGALVVVAAVLVQFALCLVGARAVTTALSTRLRSRRGRDVVALLAAFLAFGAGLVGQLPNLALHLGGDVGLDRLAELGARTANLVGALPPGWAARAILAAAGGRLGAALAWLAGAVGLVALLVWWWVASVEASLQTAPPAVQSSRDAGLFPWFARGLPRNRAGATAAKELRYASRLPQLRATYLILPLALAVLVLATALLPPLQRPLTVLLVPLLLGPQAMQGLNLFGVDGSSAWLLLATGRLGRADLLGKSVAVAVLVLPVSALGVTAIALLTGGWLQAAGAFAACVALLAVGHGVGAVASVLAPQPVSEASVNLWAGGTGTGCQTVFVQFAALLTQVVVLAPAVVGLGLAAVFRPGWLWGVVLVTVVYSLLVWWAGLGLGDRLLERRAPELVEALAQRAGLSRLRSQAISPSRGRGAAARRGRRDARARARP